MAYNIQCIEMCAYMREGASNNPPQPPHLLVLYRMSSISTTWATKTTNPNLIGLFQNMIPAPPEQVQLQTLLCGSWIGRCFAQPYFHTMDTWGRSGRKKQLIPKPLSLTGAVAFDVICFISFTSPPAHQLSTIAFLKASPQPSKSNESPVQVSVVVSCHISFLSPARRPLVHRVKIPPAIWSTNSPLTNSVVDVMMMMMLYSGKIATIIIEIVLFGRTAWSRDGGRSQHEETHPLLANLGQYMGALPQTSWRWWWWRWWWWWWLLSGPTCGSLITQLRLTYRSHLTSLTIDQHAVFAFLELQVNLELFRFGTEAFRPQVS